MSLRVGSQAATKVCKARANTNDERENMLNMVLRSTAECRRTNKAAGGERQEQHVVSSYTLRHPAFQHHDRERLKG